MRSLWIDEGNDANYDLAMRFGFDTLYFSMKDTRLSRAYLQDVEAHGFGVGVYAVSGWGGWGYGVQFAEKVLERLGKLQGIRRDVNFPRVQLDMEEHDPTTILHAIDTFRAAPRRRWHSLSWTMEPMQGGWMPPHLVDAIIRHRVRVVPQYYGGRMQPFAQDICFKDLLDRGFPPTIITGFYDAAALPLSWDGFAFTQGRLPA